MYTMYNRDSVWLATSKDGVHWKDYGVVLKAEGFKNNTIFKQYVTKVGDRYIMDYGAFTDRGTNNNLLRFYESKARKPQAGVPTESGTIYRPLRRQ